MNGAYNDGNFEDLIETLDLCIGHALLEVVLKPRSVRSLLEFGSGIGALAQLFMEHQIDVSCVDGNPMTPVWSNHLCSVFDLATPVGWEYWQQYDFVVSLEVGEHIPLEYEQIFFDNIAAAASRGVVLSWAPDGQGGEGHVNPRPSDYVIEQMQRRGFAYFNNQTRRLRRAVYTPGCYRLWWFANTLLVFHRIIDASDTECRYFADVIGSTRADTDFWSSRCHSVPASATHIELTMGSVVDNFKPSAGLSVPGQTKHMRKDMCHSFAFVKQDDQANSAFWSSKCHSLPASATHIKLTMGSVVDYFQPKDGSSVCDMLRNNDKHLWSRDGQAWEEPSKNISKNIRHLGGSSEGHPNDGRKYVSFWGSSIRRGGCCHTSYSDLTGWNTPFTVDYCVSEICHSFAFVRSSETANHRYWSSRCSAIPASATYVKIMMGAVVDYFKPVNGSTICDMLGDHSQHMWSRDGRSWMQPPSDNSIHLGGSSPGHPSDGRNFLSFWGSHQEKGGCCHSSYTGAANWNMAFTMSYCL